MNAPHDEESNSQDQQSTQNMGLEVRKTANEAIISKLYVNITNPSHLVFLKAFFVTSSSLSFIIFPTLRITLLSSAALLGYFQDDFITYFAHPALPNKTQRQIPTSSNPHIHYSGSSSIIDPAMNPARAGSQYDVCIFCFITCHLYDRLRYPSCSHTSLSLLLF